MRLMLYPREFGEVRRGIFIGLSPANVITTITGYCNHQCKDLTPSISTVL